VNVIFVTLKKELMSYCFSPVSYVIAVLFYLFRGLEVNNAAHWFAESSLDQDLFATRYFGLQSTFFMALLVPPLLTMRCFAEERRSGSIETLMTAPVRDVEIVLGKWLAAVVFFALLWLPSVVILWVLTHSWFLNATNFSFGPVFTGYLGLFLLSSLLLAVGCFTSSLTDNLLLAVIASCLCNFALLAAPELLYDKVRPYLGDYYVSQLYEKLNVMDHLGNWFMRGLVDTSQIAFYVGGIAFFLFLTVSSLGARRLA
jgi:gliding motility-associated transport system permease protein